MQGAVIRYEKRKRETYALRAKCSTIPEQGKNAANPIESRVCGVFHAREDFSGLADFFIRIGGVSVWHLCGADTPDGPRTIRQQGHEKRQAA